MKKFICVLCFVVLLFCGCESDSNHFENSTTRKEKPILCQQAIDVTIIKYRYNHWYASAHHYTAEITVRNEEYNLEETFSLNGDEAKRMEDYRRGDTIKAVFYYWKIDGTNEITKREIGYLKP